MRSSRMAVESGVPAARLEGTSEVRGSDGAADRRSQGEEPKAITLSFVLENDSALIPAVVCRLMEAAGRFFLFDEAVANRVGMAVHEAMLNGIHHGNLELDSALRVGDETAYHRLAMARRKLEPYRGRRLHVQGVFDNEAAIFVIRDDGPGFNPSVLPDPTRPPSLERPSGRGLLLIRSFMDEVTFNATGNEITLVKRRTARP